MQKLRALVTLPIIAILAFAVSCSDKYKSLTENTDTPQLNVDKTTLTIREQDYTNLNSTDNGKLTLYVKNTANVLNLTFQDTSGKVHFLYRGQEIQTFQSFPVTNDSMPLFVTCDQPGRYTVPVQLTDKLGRKSGTELSIRCLMNKKATPAFSTTLTDSSIAENWTYMLDASASKKTDGLIREFHFTINGQNLVTNQPAANWTFHARGTQTISLYLTDDLGLNSDTITHQILIP